jgi:peptidylprolyl isomerase
MMKKIFLGVSVLAVLAVSACGSSNAATSASLASTSGKTCTVDDYQVTGVFGAEPKVMLPTSCVPPTTLLTKDLITGTGTPIISGSNVVANYYLQSITTGEFLQSSFSSTTFNFTAGKGMVIPGWDQGLLGAKANGRRLLIIPPALAYGSQQMSKTGNGNETLLFVTDIVTVG